MADDALRALISKDFVLTLINMAPQYKPQIGQWIQQCGVSEKEPAEAAKQWRRRRRRRSSGGGGGGDEAVTAAAAKQ